MIWLEHDKKLVTDRFKVEERRGAIGFVEVQNHTRPDQSFKTYNTVTLKGREYIAQKLSGVFSQNPLDLRDYWVTYFAIGSGGASTTDPTLKLGPYPSDTDLRIPITLSANTAPYLRSGILKPIAEDGGGFTIEREQHDVVDSTGQVSVDAYTALKFVMQIPKSQPSQKPIAFNEAGLYAVRYDANDKPTDDHFLFARITTATKWLETTDSLTIIWWILV